ncbi:CHASE3 domain-containing protein [Streptomyces sp. PTM05]|uniref:histidine kinase n=1 Tax=Streptantibioticus parmotrematis TaxID=2873249 RepID=A0ABS7QLB1_9ACTN|nr:sensor histidine kinase [Streptantibioticus parmotrematis]MBY8883459.1 CHASE3 domain-containing protein [Streptantibioticus parmotrematis]
MTQTTEESGVTQAARTPRSTERGGLTVQGWCQLMAGVMTVLVVIAGAVGVVLFRATQDASDQLTDHLAPARVSTATLQAALVDQETGVRGYVISRNTEFLQPYTQGLATERQTSATITRLVGNRPVLVHDLKALEGAAATWRRQYAEPIVAATRAGRTVSPSAVDGSKNAFDHLRTLMNAQNAHFDSDTGQLRDRLNTDQTVRNATFAALLVLFLLTGIALMLLARRNVGRPLESLRLSVRQVAGGDFSRPIPADGPRDIRDLGEDVDSMRETIVAALTAAREQQAVLSSQAIELQRSNAELEQFAYVASHDLQEPLRKVASFCQLIEKRYGDQLDERGTQYIAFAVDGAKRMQVLINDLLTFSRVGRHYDAREPVDLGATLGKALANLEAVAEETRADIERPGDLPVLTGDPTLLTMLWQNLVGNAIKFRVPDSAPHVRIECERDEDGMWRLTVTDDGIGIPPEFAEKVFVIFQRLHTRDAYEGTGIGLAMCKKIVEHHGGRIWLDTTRDQGTRVCFTLPAQGAPARHDAARTMEGSPA